MFQRGSEGLISLIDIHTARSLFSPSQTKTKRKLECKMARTVSKHGLDQRKKGSVSSHPPSYSLSHYRMHSETLAKIDQTLKCCFFRLQSWAAFWLAVRFWLCHVHKQLITRAWLTNREQIPISGLPVYEQISSSLSEDPVFTLACLSNESPATKPVIGTDIWGSSLQESLNMCQKNTRQVKSKCFSNVIEIKWFL